MDFQTKITITMTLAEARKLYELLHVVNINSTLEDRVYRDLLALLKDL